ncbi:dTMP kinase [uncultured Pseudokineococcus sp.]|uniref:dTMP kinase n=1 Tax=uncultured Pseudokineococcus sp. TaxID=1642928 RepID=UPI0026298387|nr:dTMP kinase [uncultured Pseudokineococcus sp.]
MSSARPPRPTSRGAGRPAAPRPGRGASPAAPEVPAGRLPLHRPEAVLPAGDLAGAVDVLWVLSAASAAVAAGLPAGAPLAGVGLALVLALRLAPRALAPAPVAALGRRLGGAAPVAGHVVRALAALGLVVALTWAGTGALWWAAGLVLLAEVVRPAPRASAPVAGSGLRRVVAALPPVAVALVLGAVGRALEAVTGVLGAPAPALLAVAGAGAALAPRHRTATGAAEGAGPADGAEVSRPRGERLRALRLVVATPRGAARSAALVPVAVAAALAPLHAPGLGAGASGAALLLLALGAGLLAGSALAARWATAGDAPGSVLTLAAGTASALVLVGGPLTDLVLTAVLLALAGGAAGVALVASAHLEDGGRAVAARGAEPLVLGVVVVLGALLAGLLGGTTFPLGSAGRLDVGGAGVVLLLVGLAGLVASLVVVRPLADRASGPLLPVLLARATSGAAAPPGGPARARRASQGDAGGHGLPGVLVALEGGDGAGKTTQAVLLGRELERRGHDVVVTREPGATPLGARVRGLLLDRGADQPAVPPRAEALLYAADRAAHVHEVLRPALARGAVVVTDRYVDSSLAYQGAGRALPADEVAWLSGWATEGLLPDLVVVLDADAATASSRRGARGADDRLDAEPAPFHERVRQVFLDLARRGGDRYLVLDAGAAPEDVAARVLARLEPLLPGRPDEDAARDDADGHPLDGQPVDGDPRDADDRDDDASDDRRGDDDVPSPAVPGSTTAGRPQPAVVAEDTAVVAGGPVTAPLRVVPPPEPDGEDAPRGGATAREQQVAEARRVEATQALEREAAEERERGPAEAREREAAEAREREAAEAREREEAERREREVAEAREREAAEAREREEADAREREAAELREGEAAREREEAERERRRAEEAAVSRRVATSVRSAEAAVGAARALGDARRPVVTPAPASARSAEAPPALSAVLPEERLRQLPDAVRRSAGDVAGAQREARDAALTAAAEQRARLRQEQARAGRERQRAQREADERARAAEEERVRREEAERAARREAEEEAAEQARRASSRRRAETVRLEDLFDEEPGRAAADPAPRTAELPAVGSERPALHELEAADRRRQALQRARRRAAASRRRAESEDPVRARRDEEAVRGDGPLADELFSWEEEPEDGPEDERGHRR